VGGGGGSLDECGPLPPGGHFLRGLAEEGAAMLGQSMMEAHPPPYLRTTSKKRDLLDPLARHVILIMAIFGQMSDLYGSGAQSPAFH